ncbi:MAG: AmmeMemoRadiSam system radical SAM enzyme [Acidobacteria bacterium]|nr:AmmeMemoRadiSam system radical SAM enzyme [Acidobacteriota bacterium]MCI0722689.1 AmmeMemoRadiSam system radical SAM enzyme [Acidobacteriota bacterium]
MVARTEEPSTLRDVLSERTVEGILYEKLHDNRVRCFACGHRCVILEGLPGICKVRFNHAGTLYVPQGYVGALQCDPVEKKPFFHALPGSLAMSFGMLGCDFHCAYCQNWFTSQALRDPNSTAPPRDVTADDLVQLTRRYQARILASTYNEPLITSEWAVEVFREAKQQGLKTAYISNGNGTPEVIDYLRPWVDLYKVDLKSFRDRNYRKLGGRLDGVLETIRQLYEKGFWLEIVTLIIPGFNDSSEELSEIARFLAGISSDIPWHVTAFHKDYKMTGPDNTPVSALIRAAEIGRAAGLRYVYAGNLPGHVGAWENTCCPDCNALLIERRGFRVLQNLLTEGACPSCHAAIPGVWN